MSPIYIWAIQGDRIHLTEERHLDPAVRRNESKMNAKTFLSQAYILQQAIRIKREQISQMRDLLTNISVSYDKEKITSTPDSSPLEKNIVQMIEMKQELEDDIAQLAVVQKETLDIINRVENVKAREVLSKHYLGFKSWRDIAEEMDISQKWAQNLHTKGLQHIDKLLQEKASPQYYGKD